MALKHITQEGKYEIHLTFTEPQPAIPGWWASKVDHDEDGKHFLTTWATTKVAAHKKIRNAMRELSSPPVRVKIEHVVYDVRSSHSAEESPKSPERRQDRCVVKVNGRLCGQVASGFMTIKGVSGLFPRCDQHGANKTAKLFVKRRYIDDRDEKR